MQLSNLYLFILSLFKFAVGAVLLLVGWDALGLNGDPAINVAIVTGLSFIPAAFARPLYSLLMNSIGTLVMPVSFVLACISVLCESILFETKGMPFFLIHLLLWTSIFLIEVACERWFYQLMKTMKPEKAKRLSGLSTAVIQFSVIGGPICTTWVRPYGFKAPYYAIACVLLLAGISTYLFYTKSWLIADELAANSSQSLSTSSDSFLRKVMLVAFAMIWPTIALFNMAVPIVAKGALDGGIDAAAYLEIAIAVSTALAGLFYARLSSAKRGRVYSVMAIGVITLSMVSIWLAPNSILVVLASVVGIGLGYGYFRVESRTILSVSMSPQQATILVANANALSAPLIVFALGFYYKIINRFGLDAAVYLMPMAFFASGLLFFISNRLMALRENLN